MDCDRIEEMISEELAEEITPESARALADHLETCDACRSLADDCRRQHREIIEAFAARRRSADELSARLSATFSSAPPISLPPVVMRPLHRLAPIAAALVIGFALGWVALAVSRPETPSGEGVGPVSIAPARLAYATGPVEVRTAAASDWSELDPGQPLPAGAGVRCAPDTLCELHGADGSVLRLDRGTEVRVLGSRNWELAGGRMGTRVARGVTPFGVHVSGFTVTALGTRFDLQRTDEGTVLNVFEGTTRVRVADRTQLVRRGEAAQLAESIRVSKIDAVRLAQSSSWMNALLTLEGRGDEVARRLDELLAGLGQSKLDLLYEQEIRELGTSCVVPLLRFIASPRSSGDPRKRQKAARIVADLATDESIDDLVELLADGDGKVRASAAGALERITGTDRGFPAEKWSTSDWDECEPAYLQWEAWARSRRGGNPVGSR